MNTTEMIFRLEKRIRAIEVALGIEPDKDLLTHPKSVSQAAAKAAKEKAEKLAIGVTK